jgi:FtsZ-binding cell division protein ZapB
MGCKLAASPDGGQRGQSERRAMMRRFQLRLVVLAVLGTVALGPGQVLAEQEAWISGDVKLNVRTGPSTGHRIVAGLGTGDNVLILARADSWTQIRTERGKEGWIPAGYLNSTPPPNVRLDQLETELSSTLEQLTLVTSEAERLREENLTLADRDEEQQSSIRSLTEENLDLAAGARWPYLISGASILGIGIWRWAGQARRRPASGSSRRGRRVTALRSASGADSRAHTSPESAEVRQTVIFCALCAQKITH